MSAPVSNMPRSTKLEPKARILELLGESRIMTVATLRPDGWPQATVVGYAHDDLTLYFVVARTSQKLANIQREPRISIALGHQTPDRLRGLSMAAHAAEVIDLAEIEHLNQLMLERYPEQVVFSPREASTAVLRATPVVISIIDLPQGPGEPDLIRMQDETTTHRVRNTAAPLAGGPADVEARHEVVVHYLHSRPDANRPGVPP
jgi:nitroimidazol reductase NimA-like FMN-containing flavoprotein (pyridoxamine 5'-phosphate oxidase superfamily)